MAAEVATVWLRAPRRSDRGVYRALDDEQRALAWRKGDADDPWVGIDLEADDHHGFDGPDRYLFTVENRDAAVVGRAQVDRIVAQHRRARVTVEVLPEVRDHGVGSAALQLLARFAFARLDLHKLWGEVRSDNEGALQAAQRCGFRADSRRLGERFDGGVRHDVIVVSCLADDVPPTVT